MTAQNLEELVRSAEHLYEEKLRAHLEQTHPDEFLAIEPVSGDFF